MNTIYQSGKLKISVYVDHAPPHFHVRTPEGDSTVDLKELTVTAGRVNRKLLAEAIAWALDNRELLWEEWRKLNGD